MSRRLFPLVLLFTLGMCGTAAAAPAIFNGHDVERWSEGERRPVVAPEAGQLLVVRLGGRPSPATRAELTAAGLRVLSYVPDNAWVVRVEEAGKVASLLQARAVGDGFAYALDPARKFPGYLLAAAPHPDARVPLALHVTDTSAALERDLAALGATITQVVPGKGRIGVTVAGAGLDALVNGAARLPQVYSINPAGGARLLNDNAAPILQSGSVAAGRPLWQRGLRGEGQVIAVCDTGLDWDSCYFREANGAAPPLSLGAAAGTPDLTRRKVIIYDLLFFDDFGANDDDFDNQGHGTSVSGNALGSLLADPFAVDERNGMAPAAQLIVQDGGFDGTDDCADLAALGCPVVDLTPLLEQAVAQGAHVHNNSWADRENFFPQNTYTAPTADMDDIVWRHPEFLIVCAAGNGGPDDDTVGSPSIGKNVLSVGATASPSLFQGSAENITNFSSRGFAADERIKPDLTAPGVGQTSTNDGDVTTDNCNFGSFSGTSMASPIAAGMAALARQYFTEGWYPTGAPVVEDAFVPTAALLKATLIAGAVNMSGVMGQPPNRAEGWGRIHLEQALFFAGDARGLIVEDRRAAFASASDAAFELEFDTNGIPAGGFIRVALAWTDFPASPGASTALINDLNLEVVDDAAEVLYRGNNIDAASGLTAAGGAVDTRNNVEVIALPGNVARRYRVRVTPSTIVEAPQGFALAITGDVTRVVAPPAGPAGITTY